MSHLFFFLFVPFVFSSFVSDFLPSCGLLEYFCLFSFDLSIIFLSISLCIAFLVVALQITVYSM